MLIVRTFYLDELLSTKDRRHSYSRLVVEFCRIFFASEIGFLLFPNIVELLSGRITLCACYGGEHRGKFKFPRMIYAWKSTIRVV